MPTTDFQKIIDKYYPENSRRRDIYMRHCEAVAGLALSLNQRLVSPLDPAEVEAAAMLHDIGIVMTNAADMDCHGSLPYIAHGIAGADILRAEGLSETMAHICERHTGSGLTLDEIETDNLPLPLDRAYMPETTLERLICYADKFYSKSGNMEQKTIEQVRRSMARHGDAPLARFEALAVTFGLPE